MELLRKSEKSVSVELENMKSVRMTRREIALGTEA